MRKTNKKWRMFKCFLALIVTAGCAHTEIPSPHDRSEPLDPQDKLIIERKVNDARYVNIESFEHMKVNRPLLERLESYDSLQGLESKKSFVEQFLKDAYALNDRVTVDAAKKLTAEEISVFLSMPYDSDYDEEEFDVTAPGRTPRERFINGYRMHASEEFEKELKGFQSLHSEEAVDQYWKVLVSNIEESIITKGRFMRMISKAPFVPFIYAWIWYHAETDDRGPHAPEFSQRTVFYPEEMERKTDPSDINDDESLLRYYAPVIIQEKAQNPPYDPSVDRFGEVRMQGNALENAVPEVDTDNPALYAYVDSKRIQGQITRQVVYTFWYPEHPKLHRFDPEAGPMEGWTLRITLNRKNEPLVYESVSNCGCYYKVFPTQRLENWAMEEYKEKLDGKSFYLENEILGKIDVVIPEVVAHEGDEAGRAACYYSAGKHQLVTIRPKSQMESEDRRASGETYRLLAYELLENLPFGGRRISLFDENGLVRKAHRLECKLLAPSGIFHAGHPRQRRTQMIYFDQAEFDDSKLFETYMRLPKDAFTR